MCPGVSTAQRTCQGAAVNRANRPGKRLLSPVAFPGEAVLQLPRLGLPLVFRARTSEPNNNIILFSSANDPNTSGRSIPLVGKVVITLATAATHNGWRKVCF
jgi:hypothetical protein